MSNGWELLRLEGLLWVLRASTGLPIYDFDFPTFFPCIAPRESGPVRGAVARVGAFQNYDDTYAKLLGAGIELIHNPEVYSRITELSGWYPLIAELTPRSCWFSQFPTHAEIENDFDYPVFVKGLRQTSRHQRALSIINSRKQLGEAAEAYREDNILRWQPVVVREYIPLRLVEDTDASRIPSSFEFRTFWWRGRFVGAGRYWWQGRGYEWKPSERDEGLALAADVAKRVNACFLVVDIAQTTAGRWIVIECNDGQESGYAGLLPIALWQNILQLEGQQELMA